MMLLQVSNAAFLLWAILLLLLPLKWLLAAATAAIIHELSHIIAIRLLGGSVRRIFLGPTGAVIETSGIEGMREVLCALAGPAGSLLLLSLIHRFPTLGLCALVQGIFNLLPVYPLDGGRALFCLLEGLWPHKAERIVVLVEICVFLGLFLVSVILSIRTSLGMLPSVFCILGIGTAFLRKKP